MCEPNSGRWCIAANANPTNLFTCKCNCHLHIINCYQLNDTIMINFCKYCTTLNLWKIIILYRFKAIHYTCIHCTALFWIEVNVSLYFVYKNDFFNCLFIFSLMCPSCHQKRNGGQWLCLTLTNVRQDYISCQINDFCYYISIMNPL